MSGRGLILTAILLVAAVLVAYWPIWENGFVAYDDDKYVTENPHVLSGVTLEGVRWAFTTGHAANWHPLTWLSHMLDVELYGTGPWGHHLTAVLFHAANAVLVLLVMLRYTGRFWCSLCMAGLFALHPLRVESVAWVSERKDVLSLFFWLLTMWAYWRYAVAPSPGRYLLVLLAFVLGLLSKPMVVTLPFVLLLLDYWPLRRWGRAGESGREAFTKGQSAGVRRLLLEKLPLLLLVVGSCVITFIVQQRGGAVVSMETYEVSARLANAVVSYMAYIGKLFWPTRLAVFYPHPRVVEWGPTVVSLALLVVLSAGVWRWRRSLPWLIVGWLWYLGTLVPVIGVVQVGLQARDDRYTYIPMLGILLMLIWSIARLSERWPRRRRMPMAAVVGGVLIACSILTARQVPVWRSEHALFAHAMEVTENNYIAYCKVANDWLEEGRVDEAIELYEQALAFVPTTYYEVHNNLGIALVQKGAYEQAEEHFREAIEISPRNATAHFNLGNAVREQGRPGEALSHYTTALTIDDSYPDAHHRIATLFEQLGRPEDAIRHYRRFLELEPDHIMATGSLGLLYMRQNDYLNAIRQFQRVLALDPDDFRAYNNIGNARLAMGQLDQAITAYRQALKRQPGQPEIVRNLNNVMEQKKKALDTAP